MAAVFGDADLPPEKELEDLHILLLDFRRVAGAFPVAEDNRGVMAQLTRPDGTRPALFPADHPRLNERGELIDAWGTPYFFHHLSRLDLEIRSAGPDQTLFTPDDLVTANRPNPENRR
jgi:hypothetical protein